MRRTLHGGRAIGSRVIVALLVAWFTTRAFAQQAATATSSSSSPPPASAAPPERNVEQTELRVTGPIDFESVRRVALHDDAAVTACFRRSRSLNVTTVMIEFTIAPGGSVQHATVSDDGGDLADEARCAARAIARWTFPSPRGSAVSARIGYRYRPLPSTIAASPFGAITRGAMATGTDMMGRPYEPVTHRDPPYVRPERATADGDLNVEFIRRTALQNFDAAGACRDEAVRHDPGLLHVDGRITVAFSIGAGGAVAAPTVASSSSPHLDAMASCLASAVRRWQFQPPIGHPVLPVLLPFMVFAAEPRAD